MDVRRVDALRWDGNALEAVADALAVEAVLQIRVNGAPYTTTVRTPGKDSFLARGLLHSERVLLDSLAPVTYTEIEDPETGYPGAIDVVVSPAALATGYEDRRSIAATASCGLCGTREADDLKLYGGPLHIDVSEKLALRHIGPMFEGMRASQRAFAATGGCHAAAAFTLAGEMLASHEDIGRHNAVDKVIGNLLHEERLEEARCLAVSGRLSYEIVFKAFHAQIPFLLAVSAPSTLAVEMARQFGLTLIAFCRAPRATIYAHPENCT
jgi:FdhD protein